MTTELRQKLDVEREKARVLRDVFFACWSLDAADEYVTHEAYRDWVEAMHTATAAETALRRAEAS